MGFAVRDGVANQKTRRSKTESAEAGLRIRFLEESVAQLTKQRDEARGALDQQVAGLRQVQRELQETRQSLEHSKGLIAAAESKSAKTNEGAAKARNRSPSPYPAPEMAVFRSKQREWRSRATESEEFRRHYAGLVQRLALNESDTGYFLALLAEREQVSGIPQNLKLNANSSPDEIREKIRDAKIAGETVDDKIRAFLNAPEDFETFKKWEDTKYQRALIDGFKWAFDSFGEPLTHEQEDRLADLYGAAGKQDMQYTVEELKKNSDASNRQTPAMKRAAQILADQSGERMDRLVLRGAAGILSPAQHKIFGLAIQAMREDIDKLGSQAK